MRKSSLVAGLAMVLAACGGGDTKGTADQQAGSDQSEAPAATTPAATTPTAAGATHDVNMVLEGSSYKYVPDQLTVGANDLIRYHNKSGGPHNVAFWADSIPSGASSAITVPEPMAPLSSKLVGARRHSMDADAECSSWLLVQRGTRMTGLRPLGAATARIVDEVRLRRLVQHLHQLGPRPLAHFLQELVDDFDLAAPVAEKLEAYGRVDAEFVRSNRGDELGSPPLHVVAEE